MGSALEFILMLYKKDLCLTRHRHMEVGYRCSKQGRMHRHGHGQE